MKIDITARVQESLASEVSFEDQLAAAKASGRPFATAVLMDGRRAVYFHTAEERAHFATYQTPPREPTPGEIEHEALRAKLTQADLDAARARLIEARSVR